MRDIKILGLSIRQWEVIGFIVFLLVMINVLIQHIMVKDVLVFRKYVDNAWSTCDYVSSKYLSNSSVYETELEVGNYVNYVRVERVGVYGDRNADVYLYIRGREDGYFDVMVLRCTPESYKLRCGIYTAEGDKEYVVFYGTYLGALYLYKGERPEMIEVICQ